MVQKAILHDLFTQRGYTGSLMTVQKPLFNAAHLPEIEALFESLHEGVIVWDVSRILVYANSAARSITGLSLTPGTLLENGSAPVTAFTSHHTSTTPDAHPAHRAFASEDVPYEEMKCIDSDGTHRWLFVSARRVLNSNNQLAYVVSTVRDISLRKSREEKLRFLLESSKILSLDLAFEERLTEKAKLAVPRLADWCSISILHSGALRRVVAVHDNSKEAKELTTSDNAFLRDSVTKTIQDQRPMIIHRKSQHTTHTKDPSAEQLAALRSLGFSSMMVIPILSRGGGAGAMTVAYAESGRTYDENDLEFFEEFCHHVSVLFDNARLFAEIEQRDKAKDIFLAALSHELRNPLAPIKSSLELLKIRDLPRDVREEIDIVEHQFDHMAHLLNDLLDVTRFTQDRIALSTQPVELRRLVDLALRSTDTLIRNANITLHFTYPSSPISVIADETRLEQAVSNLLSNAVKFTPAGGSIWMDLEYDGVHAIIRIRDNGAGIDAADLPHIFDMYYQGAQKSTVNSGLGIGLLLVQRIITLHGGTVEATSSGRGGGSEFTIRLPLAEVAASDPVPRTPKSIVRNLSILVVDDNSAAADSLVRLLNKLGAHARAAYSGHETLGTEQLGTIDLFLLDIGMPHMDGYELVTALRKRGISAPIVALTGYGLIDDKDRAYAAGFSSHLTKPIGLNDLYPLFEEFLVTTS